MLHREIRASISKSITDLKSTSPSFQLPQLLILQLGTSPASSTYIRMKIRAGEESGMGVEHVQVPAGPDGVKQILELVRKANTNPKVNGLLVQLPLEGASKEEERLVVESVSVEKDVDGYAALE